MTNDAVPLGTTAIDLEAVRAVLLRGDRWSVNEITDADAPWITASAPDGTDWTIGRTDEGVIFAAPDSGVGKGREGFADFGEAARYVADSYNAA